MRAMSLRVSFVVAIALAIVGLPTFAGAGTTLDRVVAVVNREVVLASELERRVRESGVDKRMVLGEMVDEILLAQEARARYLTASDEEIDKALAEVKSANGLSQDELIKQLADAGYSLEEYRRELERQIMALRIINLDVKAHLAGQGPDAVRHARDKYVNDLRARAYVEIRLGAEK